MRLAATIISPHSPSSPTPRHQPPPAMHRAPNLIPPLPALRDHPPAPLPYLPHLDGLRALALLGVLAFHLSLPFPRGYLGVDSFLLLSGFLITRTILPHALARTFSLPSFYSRRFWRLYPSALATTAATLILTLFFADVKTTRETAASALAGLALLSNLFWRGQRDYFASDAQKRPLLHLWSLSLEDQFYALWPAVLILAAALTRRTCSPTPTWILLTTFCVASYAITHASSDADFNFYLLPARVFEFAAGAIIYLAEPKLASLPKTLQTSLSLAALPLVIFAFASDRPPRAMSTLLAITGTGALVATPGSFVSTAVLSSSPFRNIGTLSYAAYLTHWPLWVFGNILGYPSSPLPKALYVVLQLGATFATAHILHSCVEVPFRCAKLPSENSRRQALTVAALALTATAAFLGREGWTSRFTDHQTTEGEMRKLRAECVDIAPGNGGGVDMLATHGCLAGGGRGWRARARRRKEENEEGEDDVRWVQEERFRALVIGNSFARQLAAALAAAFDEGEPFLLSFRNGCRLVLRREVQVVAGHLRHFSPRNRCKYQNERWWRLVEALPKASTVVLAQDWRAKNERRRAAMRERIRGLVMDMWKLKLKLVIVTPVQGAVVSYGCDEMGTSKWATLRLLSGVSYCPDRVRGRVGFAEAVTEIHNLSRSYAHRLSVVDVYPYICPDRGEGMCSRTVALDGKRERLYSPDSIHLSYLGSRALAPAFRDFFGS